MSHLVKPNVISISLKGFYKWNLVEVDIYCFCDYCCDYCCDQDALKYKFSCLVLTWLMKCAHFQSFYMHQVLQSFCGFSHDKGPFLHLLFIQTEQKYPSLLAQLCCCIHSFFLSTAVSCKVIIDGALWFLIMTSKKVSS